MDYNTQQGYFQGTNGETVSNASGDNLLHKIPKERTGYFLNYAKELKTEWRDLRGSLPPQFRPSTFQQWKLLGSALKESKLVSRIFYGFCRMLISMYFINTAWMDLYDYYFRFGVISFPFIKVPVLICGILMFFNFFTMFTGTFLMLFAFGDAGLIVYQRVAKFILTREFYINELLTKKLSMFACAVMVLLQEPFFKRHFDLTSKAIKGFLIDPDAPKHTISNKQSIILLIVRGLISFLFLVVGIQEIANQIKWSRGVEFHGRRHFRPPGDGHNQIWLKIVQFSLVLPFAIGFKTKLTSHLLSLALVLEAMIYWPYWRALPSLGLGYPIHARDHFFTNFGVVGGLLLLQDFGVGKYSIDNLLQKKKE